MCKIPKSRENPAASVTLFHAVTVDALSSISMFGTPLMTAKSGLDFEERISIEAGGGEIPLLGFDSQARFPASAVAPLGACDLAVMGAESMLTVCLVDVRNGRKI